MVKKWYVLMCCNGKENFVKRMIEKKVRNFGLGEFVGRVERLEFYDGFLYVNMIDDEKVDCVFKGINYCKGFLVDDGIKYNLRKEEMLNFKGGKKLSLREDEIIKLGLS